MFSSARLSPSSPRQQNGTPEVRYRRSSGPGWQCKVHTLPAALRGPELTSRGRQQLDNAGTSEQVICMAHLVRAGV
jgi:hypothetical protein